MKRTRSATSAAALSAAEAPFAPPPPAEEPPAPAAEEPEPSSPVEPAFDPLDHDGDGKPGGSVPLQIGLVLTADHGDLRATEVVWASAARAAELRAAGVARDATPAQVELAQPRVRVLA